MTALGVMALVPAYEEAAVIGETVGAIRGLAGVDLVVVVDDGSADATAEAAAAVGARVLRSHRNLGKGGALEGALCRLPVPGVYLLLDADLGGSAAAAGPLLDAVTSGDVDLAIGRLPRPSAGGFGLMKRSAGWMIRTASGFVAAEPLSGQRAVTARCLQACRPLAPGFGVETAMTIDAVRLGFRLAEIDVDLHHRPTGRDLGSFVHRARQGLDAAVATAPRLAGMR